MKRKWQAIFCSMVGAVLGAAMALSVPMWPVLYGDIEAQRPFWAAFDGFFTAADSLDEYYVPLAITAAFIAASQILARRAAERLRRRAKDRRVMRGCCAACGYHLFGNASGICPECGEAVEEIKVPKDERRHGDMIGERARIKS